MDRTTTNESRKNVVDQKYASFRGDLFFVERIFYSANPDIESKIAYSLYDNNFQYIVGQLVGVYDFDTDLDTIYTTGIHYCKDIRGAYYYNASNVAIVLPEKYSGLWKIYDQNGQITYACKFVHGNKRFTETCWNNQGNITRQINFGSTNKTKKSRTVINGQQWCIYRYPDKKDNVTETYWYENGQIKYSCTYSHGVKNGCEKHWYENGQLKYTCDYKNNLKDGLETEWYDNGLFKYQCYYEKGLRNGAEYAWFENGCILYENNYSHGLQINQYNCINKCPNKNYRTTMYLMNDYMICTYVYLGRQLICLRNNVNGKKEGTEIHFYKKDNISDTDKNIIKYKRTYDKETMLYTKTFWYKNGNIKMTYSFKNEQKQGKEQCWYGNGIKQTECYYENGQKHGKEQCWYENGKISYSVEYMYGKMHGVWCDWFENGNIITNGMYINGKMAGKWYYYSKNGKLMFEKNYDKCEISQDK